MPSKGKRPGNPHNSRHENGVVAPGKRVIKQKSNGQLNAGHLNGSAGGIIPDNGLQEPSSAIRTTAQGSEKRASGLPAAKKDGLPPVDGPDLLESEAAMPGKKDPDQASQTNGSIEHPLRKTEVKSHKSAMTNASDVVSLALTILRSCPLGDTITILIVLLSLPTALLTITNALFAMLTFMPPAGSFSSLPNTFNDIFQGSGGTPSLATILLTDFIGLVLWLVTWSPLQALAIELTQAVVATTLGGGSTSKKTGSDSTLLCMGIVTVNHVAHHGGIPERIFGFDWSAIQSSIPYVSPTPSDLVSEEGPAMTRSPAGWFRVLVALHILIQGMVHLARRWYQKREYVQTTANNKKVDPEAVAGSSVGCSITMSSETSGQIHPTVASDPKAPPPLSKDAKERISSGKKKRKQGTYVRSQQPLWAAFAATKVTVLREYEQTHSQSQSAGSNAKDTKRLGSAPFTVENDRIWVSEIQPNSFFFHTSSFATPRFEKEELASSSGIDRSKPLYVRINDTNWTSTKLERRPTGSRDKLWTGEVFGLSPSSSYRCNFVQSEDGVVVYSIIITTPPSLIPENGTPFITAQTWIIADATADSSIPCSELPHRGHRPSSPTSPTTTLRKSILSFENSLAESLARQKRSKKDNKSASAALKKDIEVFNAKITKLGGEEKGHYTRHLQWNQHMRQAEEAIVSMDDEIDSLDCIPEDDLRISQEKKANWDEMKRELTSARDNLALGKDAALRERSSVQAEATSLQQKRERLLSRKTKQNDQYDRIRQETTREQIDKERQESEQAAKNDDRAQYSRWAQEEISRYQNASQEARRIIQHNWAQVQVIASAFDEQQSRSRHSGARPLTPEGDLPGEKPINSATPAFRFPTFGTPESSSGLRSHSNSLRFGDVRPRSTSMRSGNSAYTDFEDQDPAPPMPTRAVEAIRVGEGRKGSGGSAGGSSEGNSQKDSVSPIVGKDSRSSIWIP